MKFNIFSFIWRNAFNQPSWSARAFKRLKILWKIDFTYAYKYEVVHCFPPLHGKREKVYLMVWYNKIYFTFPLESNIWNNYSFLEKYLSTSDAPRLIIT